MNQPEHAQSTAAGMPVAEPTKAPASQRSRRVRAILAGGLVLGLGAAVTLAAWNDSEFAQQTFGASSFTFTGSTDGTTFAEHATAGTAATLNPGAGILLTDMTPNEVRYLPYALQVTGPETATVTEVTPTVSGSINAEALTADSFSFASKKVSDWGCSEAIFNDVSAVSGASFTMDDDANAYLCLRVTAGDQEDFTSGEQATVVWQFNAVTS